MKYNKTHFVTLKTGLKTRPSIASCSVLLITANYCLVFGYLVGKDLLPYAIVMLLVGFAAVLTVGIWWRLGGKPPLGYTLTQTKNSDLAGQLEQKEAELRDALLKLGKTTLRAEQETFRADNADWEWREQVIGAREARDAGDRLVEKLTAENARLWESIDEWKMKCLVKGQ